jgi:hypothetical protein
MNFSDYERDASECRGLAKQAKSIWHAHLLMKLAETWEGLAERYKMQTHAEPAAGNGQTAAGLIL